MKYAEHVARCSFDSTDKHVADEVMQLYEGARLAKVVAASDDALLVGEAELTGSRQLTGDAKARDVRPAVGGVAVGVCVAIVGVDRMRVRSVEIEDGQVIEGVLKVHCRIPRGGESGFRVVCKPLMSQRLCTCRDPTQ